MPESDFQLVTAFANNLSATGDGLPLPAARVAPLVNPADHVLILFNSNGADSVTLKDYYLQNRPYISGANVLGLALPATSETISDANYVTYIRTPLVAWLNANPQKPIKYIIQMGYQMPRRISGSSNTESLCHRLSVCQQEVVTSAQVNALYYSSSLNSRYLGPNYMPGQSGIATHILGANLADEKAYIDKLKAFGALYSPGKAVISANAGGYGNSHYYFDDTRAVGFASTTFAPTDKSAVLAENASATITTQLTQAGTPIQSLANIAGYRGWGGNNGQWTGTTWITDGSAQGSGASNWYIAAPVESYSGQFNGSSQLGWYGQWFGATALHGTAYQFTPAFLYAFTEEPTTGGHPQPTFFAYWERGYCAGDCAYAAIRAKTEIFIGDPLITK